MRRRPNWMRPTDDLILGALAKSELVLTPAILAYNLDLDRSHVNKRLTEFEEQGLVHRRERGKYEIADLGNKYLNGNLDLNDLERDDQ